MSRLPRLTIVSPDVLAPILPEAVDGPMRRWRDRGGRIDAYGYSTAGAHWLHLPGLATFRFASMDEVTAIVAATVEPEWIRDAYRRTVLPFALQAFGLEVLHASAVLTRRGVAAFCAHSETGKSTVAYGLRRRGYALWADDVVAFQASSSGVHAILLPFRVRLRPASQSYFSRDGHPEAFGADEERADGRPRPLAAVFTLERVDDPGDATIEVRCLSAGGALPAVLAHAQVFSVSDSVRNRRLVEQYLALVAGVPVFRVRFRAGLERLAAILDRVEQVIG